MPPGVGYSVPNAGASHYPPSFSNAYNPSIGQQNLGAQATASIMGGIQSAPGMLAGAGMMASLGLAGNAMGMYSLGKMGTGLLTAGSMLDPLSMAFSAGRVGMGLGRGAMTLGGIGGIGTGAFGGAMGTIGAGLGGLAGAAVPAAALYGAYQGVSAFGTGGVHQAQINRMFSDYQFANPSAMGGRGFNAQQMGRIGDAMHSINTSSAFINGGDAMQLTKQFQQMGLGRGADSVGDLTTKLKEFGRVADEVAQRMGTSITQVSGLIQKMRGNGFFSSSEIAGNVTSMRTMQGMGVSNEQFLGAQQQAGATSRGMGLTNTAGANFISAAGSQMVGALQSGILDQEQMMRLTGTDHYADAGMAFAQKMQGSLGGFMKSGVGRAFLAGIGQTQGGKFTGKIDSKLLDNLSAGGDFTSIMDRGRSALQGRDAGRSFVTNQDSMLNELMGSEQGLTSMVGAVRSMASKANLGDDEDAFVLLGKRMQMGTEMELRELFKFAEKQKQVRKDILRRKAMELSTERFQTSMSRNSFTGQMAKLSGQMSDTLLAPIEHAGAHFMTSGSSMFEKMNIGLGERITGMKRDTFSVSQDSIDEVNRQLTMGTAQRSIQSDVRNERTVMGGDSKFLAFVDSDHAGRGGGALDTANGNRALMIQRAAASKSFGSLGDLLAIGIPESRKKDLDSKIANVAADRKLQSLIGEAREAKLSGSSGALADKVEAIREHMLNKGYASKGNSHHDVQYLLTRSKVGGEDIIAKDLANATLTLSGGETTEQKEDRAFKSAMMRNVAGANTPTGEKVAAGTAGVAGAGVGLLAATTGLAAAGTAIGAGSLAMMPVIGGAATAVGSAMYGASVGSVVPVVGTLIGAAVGAVAGYAMYEYMKPEEQKIMEDIMDNGTGIDLMGSLKSPAEMSEFSKILEEYKKNITDEDEAYEAAAKAFSAKYGKKISAKDVRTTDKAMTQMSGMNSNARARATVTDLANNKGLKDLMGYTRFKSQTKARAKINEQMMNAVSKNLTGMIGESDLLSALQLKEGEGKDAKIKESLNKMIDHAVETGDFSASDSDPVTKRAIAAAATIRRDIGTIEGDISEEDLAKKLNTSVEDVRAFRKVTGGTGLVTKSEIDQLGSLLSENQARKIFAEGGAGVGMTTGGEFAGTDAELQAQAMQKTAFMIDALYARATGTDASTSGGQRVLNSMNTNSPDGV